MIQCFSFYHKNKNVSFIGGHTNLVFYKQKQINGIIKVVVVVVVVFNRITYAALKTASSADGPRCVIKQSAGSFRIGR